MPEDGIVCLDNGMYKIWFARNYRTHVANTLLLDNALATMGAGLPSAMMAAMLYPERRVMAVCGDGGFMMNSQEMETAVRLGLNLVVVILNDNAYGMIRWKQAVDNFPDFGMTFGNPDFVRYAEAYGAKGSRVNAVEELAPTLEAAFKGGGVHLVECRSTIPRTPACSSRNCATAAPTSSSPDQEKSLFPLYHAAGRAGLRPCADHRDRDR
jgi:acetolactate synthase-1/2/3 large subunit